MIVRDGSKVLLSVAITVGGLFLPAVPAAVATTSTPSVQDVNAEDYAVYGAHGFETYRFTSPDRNVTCELYETWSPSPWSCAANQHSWKMPSLPTSTAVSQYVGKDALTSTDVGGTVVRVPYTAPDPGVELPTKVLPRNARISIDGLVCTARHDRHGDRIDCVARAVTG